MGTILTTALNEVREPTPGAVAFAFMTWACAASSTLPEYVNRASDRVNAHALTSVKRTAWAEHFATSEVTQ